MRVFYTPDEDEAPMPSRPCDREGCPHAGEYPAPKSRTNLQERYYFCLDHVREYNKNWNFFSGFSEEQMYAQMRQDTAWDRPTWPAGIPLKMEARLNAFIRKFGINRDEPVKETVRNAPLTKEARALDTLGLNPGSDRQAIKTRYRELVKRYHPDRNPNNPKAIEHFKIISEAYMILEAHWLNK